MTDSVHLPTRGRPGPRVLPRGNDYSDRVPAIAEALAALRVKSVTLDGEGVLCDPDGVTDFDLLRAALGRRARGGLPVCFRRAELDGRDLRASPWDERRKALTKLLRKAGDESGCPSTLPRPTATRSSSTRAPWNSKASSQSAAIGHIDPGDPRLDQGQEPERAGRDQGDRRLTPAVVA